MLLENTFVHLFTAHTDNSAVSYDRVSKVSFLTLIRDNLSWWNWQHMLASLKKSDVSLHHFPLLKSKLSFFPLFLFWTFLNSAVVVFSCSGIDIDWCGNVISQRLYTNTGIFFQKTGCDVTWTASRLRLIPSCYHTETF